MTPPSPPKALEPACVAMSLLAGRLIDKLRCRLPRHRQCQNPADAGLQASRSRAGLETHRNPSQATAAEFRVSETPSATVRSRGLPVRPGIG